MTKNYYIILGVDRGANSNQIKHAYRRIAKELHPDRARQPANAEGFLEAKQAYDTLADADRRRRYDNELDRRESSWRMVRVPQMVRNRESFYREFEQRESLVDEFFEGWLPGFYSRPRRRGFEKDIFLEVTLSVNESREGGLFPIHFPVLEPCPKCDQVCQEMVMLWASGPLLGTRQDMDDIADAILKVYENRDQLAAI